MPSTPDFTTLILFCLTETIQQIFTPEPQIRTSQLNIPHPVNSTLTWVWVPCFVRDHYVFCSLCMSLSSFLFSLFVHLHFPLCLRILRLPSLAIPTLRPRSDATCFNPCRSFSPNFLVAPNSADSCLLPAIFGCLSALPGAERKGLHPLPEGPQYRRGWGLGQSGESGEGSEKESDPQGHRCLTRSEGGKAGARTRLRAITEPRAHYRVPHRATGLGTSYGDATTGDRDELPARGTKGVQGF